VKTAGTSPFLAVAAYNAVWKCRYQPTVVDGKPVAVASWVLFRFKLEGEKPSIEILTKAQNSTPPVKPRESPDQANLPQKVRVSQGVAEANIVRKISPSYPPLARKKGIQGDVVIQIVIDEQGNVSITRVISGDPALTGTALEAVKQWKYKPTLLNNQPVQVETIVTIRFH